MRKNHMRLLTPIVFTLALAPVCASAQTHDHTPDGQNTPISKTHDKHDKHDDHKQIRPFEQDRDASVDVDIAIANAKANGTRAIIVMGANWCHDSRGLAGKFDDPKFKALIAQDYELVYVDVGPKPRQKDGNPHIAERFGVGPIVGTPTVVIVDGDGQVQNADSAGYWRHAHSIPFDMAYAYFAHYANN